MRLAECGRMAAAAGEESLFAWHHTKESLFLRRAKRKASTFCKSPGQTVTLVPSGALVRWLLCEGMCGDHQTVTKSRPACADGSIAEAAAAGSHSHT